MMKTRMKRSLMVEVLAFAMVICAFANVMPTSAATLTAKQYLNKMEKASVRVKSYESTTTIVQNMRVSGAATNTKTVQKAISFSKPAKSKVVATTTMKGSGINSKQKAISYAKKNAGGKVVAYVSIDGKNYDKMDAGELSDTLAAMDTGMYSDEKIVKDNVKVNNVNTVQISAKIAGEDLGKSMEDVFAAFGIMDEDAGIDYSKLAPVKVTVWVDKKTYLPVKVTTDMTKFMNDYMTIFMQATGLAELGGTGLTYSKAVSTTTYTNYNKATDFKLPKACK